MNKSSLSELARGRIIDEMLGAIPSADLEKGSTSSVGRVFVLDSHTLKIVSSVCKRSELSEKGALFIEQIEKPRQPFPDLDVVYFITPASAYLLLKDHPIDGTLCPYKYCSVFFTNALEGSLFASLTSSAQFVSRCRNLVEFHLDFVCFEPEVFHCDSPLALHSLAEGKEETILESHIDSIASVFSSLGEKPVIRFHQKSIVSQRIALGLRRKMDSNSGLKQNGTTVLIVDRSIETGGLFVHDFYYQALVLDVLDGVEPSGVQWALGFAGSPEVAEQATSVVPSFSYTAVTGKGVEDKRKVILSDVDPLWVKFRHEHFRIVSESIAREIAALVRSTGGADSLEQLRGIPEYQDQIAKLSVHLELSQKLITVFEKLSLMAVARIEQELLTGLDDDGKEVGCTKIYQAILALLGNKTAIAPEERLRLVLLYLSQVNDVSEITAKELVHSVAGPDGNFALAVSRFLALGIHGTRAAAPEGVVAGANGARGSLITIPSNRHSLKFANQKNFMKRNKFFTRNSKFVNCRFQSELRDIVEKTIMNSLEVASFPLVGGTGISSYAPGGLSPDGPRPSVASMWGQAARQDAGRRQRLVVFVVGGVTLGETREMAEFSSQFGVDVLLGGSTILTPKRLVEILLTRVD